MVSDEEWRQAEICNEIAEVVGSVVLVQMTLAGANPGSHRSDDFTIGYVFGFADAVMQLKDIEADSTMALVALARSYRKVYGDYGNVICGYVLKRQEQPEVARGIRAGGHDCIAYHRSSGQHAPLSLARALGHSAD